MSKPLRIAYFLGDFPSASETFVLHQIAGMFAANQDVEVHAWQGLTRMRHSLLDKYGILKHVSFRPTVPDVKLWRVFKACYVAIFLLCSDRQRTSALFNMRRDMPLGEWIELFFIAFSLRGGRTYDVIHAHFGPNGLMAVRLRQAGFLQGKIVTSFHGFDANVVPHLLGKHYYEQLFKLGDGFIVSSLFIRRKLETLGCANHKIHRIAVGVDVEKWGFKVPRASVSDKPVLISVGRLVEVKGFAYAIAAMQRVKEVFPELRYDVVGDGPLREQLEQQVRDLKLQDSIRFCGLKSQDELVDMYHDADIFVMPSVRGRDGAEEGQGMVLLEAQASGLPLVATNSGGIAESVPHGVSLVKEKDSDALAQAIIDCLQAHQNKGYDGIEGYDFVRKNYDIEALNKQLLKLYKQVA